MAHRIASIYYIALSASCHTACASISRSLLIVMESRIKCVIKMHARANTPHACRRHYQYTHHLHTYAARWRVDKHTLTATNHHKHTKSTVVKQFVYLAGLAVCLCVCVVSSQADKPARVSCAHFYLFCVLLVLPTHIVRVCVCHTLMHTTHNCFTFERARARDRTRGKPTARATER